MVNELCHFGNFINGIPAWLMMDRVSDVPGMYPYCISENGDLYRLKLENGCIFYRPIKAQVNTEGYYSATLRISGRKQRPYLIHRMVAAAYLPSRQPGQLVRHLDGDKKNNHVRNLAWGSRLDNARDAVRHGRTMKGVLSPHAKLNDDLVREIRLKIKQGRKIRHLGKEYGVNPAIIRRIRDQRLWRHVE